MNDIFNIINITANSETELRTALQNAIQSNFVDYFNSNIKVTNRKCPNIKFNFSTESNSVDIYYDNTTLGVQQTITSLTYTPYVSKIAYKSYYDESYDLSKYMTSFRYEYTVLLALLLDVNIIGFSIISPSDLELINKVDDNGYSLYTISTTANNNVSIQENEDTSDISHLFPEHIRIQSGIINDRNSYYEIGYIDLKDTNSVKYLPCIGGNCYDVKFNLYEDGTFSNSDVLIYSLNSSLKDKSSDISLNAITNDSAGSLLTLPKLLVNNNNILGYTTYIYDCPSLSIPTVYTEDTYNAGDIITLNESNYLIVDNNTLLKLFNCEISSYDYNGIYDNTVHFINLNCPYNSKVYYRLEDTDKWTFIDDINDVKLTAEQEEQGICKDVGQWQISYMVIINVPTIDYLGNTTFNEVSYYGSNYVTIMPADIYGYYIANTTATYDGTEHSINIYIDNSYTVKYSLDNSTWYSTPITFTEIGTYAVYYQISKQNYNTVQGSATLTIQTGTGTVTPNPDEDNTNLLTLNTINYSTNVTKHMYYYVIDDQNVLVANTKNIVDASNWTSYSTEYEKASGDGLQLLGSINITPSKCYIVVIEYPRYCTFNDNGVITNTDKIAIYAGSTKDTSISIKVTDKHYSFLCTDNPLTNEPWSDSVGFGPGPTYWGYSYGRTILLVDLTSETYNKLDKLSFKYARGEYTNVPIFASPHIAILTCDKITLNKKTLDLNYYIKVKAKLNSNTVITTYNSEKITLTGEYANWSCYPDRYKSGDNYSFDYYKLNKYLLNYHLNTSGIYNDYIYETADDTGSERLKLKPGILTHICINNNNLAPTLFYNSSYTHTNSKYPFEMSEEEQQGSGTITFMLETLE